MVARSVEGSLTRSFTLPIQLSGVSMSINGAAAGLKSVSQQEIVFVVPPGLTGSTAGNVLPFVINNNGTEYKGTITLVHTRPDIFTDLPSPGPFGRAKITNVTNRVHTTEPFTVTTILEKGGRRVPSRMRILLTGVQNVPTTITTIRIGGVSISGASILTNAVLVAPGVYSMDFLLPPALNLAGDQPVVVTVVVDGVSYQSRLDDTASRVFIL